MSILTTLTYNGIQLPPAVLKVTVKAGSVDLLAAGQDMSPSRKGGRKRRKAKDSGKPASQQRRKQGGTSL